MTPSGGRERPAGTLGRGLLLALAFGFIAIGSSAKGQTRPPRVSTIYHKNRSFRIPFNVDPADRPRLKEVQLWVSEDSGFNWAPKSRTTPDLPAFTFRATRDAEYWFAVRTLDNKGNLYPNDDEKPTPSMKVIVDTTQPTLVLESDGRRGSLASVRWDVRDEHLDLKSLMIEYQVEGARDWRQIPLRRPALIGAQTWDAGTAELLKVRGTVSDKAGNLAETIITIPEGTPTNPGVASSESTEFSNPPPISQISSGPLIPPREEPARGTPQPSAGAGDPFNFAATSELPAQPSGASPTSPAIHPQISDEPDAFGGNQPPAATPAGPPSIADAPANKGVVPTILTPSARFPLQYAVEDAGPNGPATVELWVTQDGGRTWFRRGEDADKQSPMQVDLGGEGTYGLRLVARGASGLGDQPPAKGDLPDTWVEVDGTPPSLQMLTPVVGTGANLGKVSIRWKANDPHLAPKPIVLSWRTDEPGSRWQTITTEPVENSGKHIWTVPMTAPPRFHIRVDVVDSLGNRAFAETPENAAVVLDRARPRGRIIGLDPTARTGMGVNGRPLR